MSLGRHTVTTDADAPVEFLTRAEPGDVLNTEAGANDGILYAGINGDTTPRLAINADGLIAWGSGSTAVDTLASRPAAGILQVNNQMRARSNAAATTPLVARGAAAQSAALQRWETSAGTALADVTASGTVRAADGLDSGPAFTFLADTDTGVYRRSDDRLVLVAGQARIIDVRNTGTPGSPVRRLGFFDIATPAAQQGPIGDASGGAVIDSQARTALNALLAAMRSYGLLAP